MQTSNENVESVESLFSSVRSGLHTASQPTQAAALARVTAMIRVLNCPLSGEVASSVECPGNVGGGSGRSNLTLD